MSYRDVLDDVVRWRGEGERVALATVVHTWGSGPRRPGAKMAISADGRIAGSVSGGCVEAAVVEEARKVLDSGESKLLHYGVTDERAWEVGLSCGGTIDIFVEPLGDALFDAMQRASSESETFRRELVLDEAASRVFEDVELPPPMLVMVGGVHIAIALTSIAKTQGYRTVIVDPRGLFGNEERFGHADALVTDWPDDALSGLGINEATAVATLTHDPKLDDPALAVALRSKAFYVGALGSRRTHEKRKKRLLERGLTEAELARLHAPIGLDLGSRTPEAIALSVMAQIVATRNRLDPRASSA